jgi:Cdc6-like AAA superfamily ATPase
MIAQVAAEISDARVAIELLEGAAKRAEMSGRNSIEAKDVQKVAKLQPTNLEGVEVDDLPPHCMMVLLAVCRRLKTVSEIATGDVDSIYRVVCEEFNVEGRGHTTLWKHLKRLEERGILNARSSTFSHGRGRSQFFSMPAALPADIERRLETLIPARLRR